MTATTTQPTDTRAIQTALRGRFVWYDLVTTDIPAATAFYRKIAGWNTMDSDMPGGKYQMWLTGSTPDTMIGGSMPVAAGTPPHWMSYVSVPNVDEAARQVASLGGRVIAPARDIPTVGRFAVIADPQGATLSLFTFSDPRPRGEFAPKMGEFSWHELMTSDHRAAFAFYSRLVGWEQIREEDVGQGITYRVFGQRGTQCGGMFTMTAEMRMPPNWMYYIRVPSVDETVQTVTASGGKVLNGPMDVPGGDRIVQCMDPQGAMFALHSTKNG